MKSYNAIACAFFDNVDGLGAGGGGGRLPAAAEAKLVERARGFPDVEKAPFDGGEYGGGGWSDVARR